MQIRYKFTITRHKVVTRNVVMTKKTILRKSQLYDAVASTINQIMSWK